MERLEEQVKDIDDDEPDVDDVPPLRQIVEIIDEELEGLEKRRARLLYIRNLALGAAQSAVYELDRRKKQIMQRLVDLGPSTVDALGKALKLTETEISDVISELEKDGLIEREGDVVNLSD